MLNAWTLLWADKATIEEPVAWHIADIRRGRRQPWGRLRCLRGRHFWVHPYREGKREFVCGRCDKPADDEVKRVVHGSGSRWFAPDDVGGWAALNDYLNPR